MNDIGQVFGIIDLRESNDGLTKEFLESLGYKEIENPTLSVKVDDEELLRKLYSRKNIDVQIHDIWDIKRWEWLIRQ